MVRWVLLRHTLADGTSHLDWMIEREPGGGLLSFRLEQGVDPWAAAEFEARMIGDHRPEYLEYEGPVSGGRGGVRRIARGECDVMIESTDAQRVWVRLAGVETGRIGRPRPDGGPGVWMFELASTEVFGHTG
jgi:hypothetical protein